VLFIFFIAKYLLRLGLKRIYTLQYFAKKIHCVKNTDNVA